MDTTRTNAYPRTSFRSDRTSNGNRVRSDVAAPSRRRQGASSAPRSTTAGPKFSLRIVLRRIWASPAFGILLTTIALGLGSRLLSIDPIVTLELTAVGVALKFGLWVYRSTTAAMPSTGQQGLLAIVRDELLLGLTLPAAAFVRPWGLPVEPILLLSAANLLVQLISWLGFSLWTRFSNRTGRPLPESQIAHRVIIVGTGLRARRLADKLLDHPELRTAVTGFLDFERTDLWRYRDIPLLGHPRNFERLALSHHIDALLFAVGPEEIAHTTTLFTIAERMGIAVCLMPELYAPKLSHGKMTTLAGSPAIVYKPSATNALVNGLKEASDRTIALLILVLGFPLFVLTALAIKLDSRGPILFRQERMGRHGRRFMLYKFRTMECDAERKKRSLWSRNEMSGPVFKIKDDPRITWIGHLLRKYSIDEFPQLLNIVRGEMSLVGPRPPLPAEVNRFEPWQRRKLSVKPGLTCLWQVNGRNAVDFDHWMRLDLEYIDNWSLWLDLRILLKTVPAVLKGTGV